MSPRPKCDPPKWKVKVAADSPMFAGKTLLLCDYHKKNLIIKYEKVERLIAEHENSETDVVAKDKQD